MCFLIILKKITISCRNHCFLCIRIAKSQKHIRFCEYYYFYVCQIEEIDKMYRKLEQMGTDMIYVCICCILKPGETFKGEQQKDTSLLYMWIYLLTVSPGIRDFIGIFMGIIKLYQGIQRRIPYSTVEYWGWYKVYQWYLLYMNLQVCIFK